MWVVSWNSTSSYSTNQPFCLDISLSSFISAQSLSSRSYHGHDITGSTNDHKSAPRVLPVHTWGRNGNCYSTRWCLLSVPGAILGCATPSGFGLDDVRYECVGLLSALLGAMLGDLWSQSLDTKSGVLQNRRKIWLLLNRYFYNLYGFQLSPFLFLFGFVFITVTEAR